MHTGGHAQAQGNALGGELQRLADAAEHAEGHPLIVAAGHGLTVRNLGDLLVEAPPIAELNIGHALVSDALFYGLEGAVERFLEAIADREAE